MIQMTGRETSAAQCSARMKGNSCTLMVLFRIRKIQALSRPKAGRYQGGKNAQGYVSSTERRKKKEGRKRSGAQHSR